MTTLGYPRTTVAIPTSNVAEYVMTLARQHGVSYIETADDMLANVITRLADDEVKIDEVELLLLARERAGVIASAEVMPLHVNYLREKFRRQ